MDPRQMNDTPPCPHATPDVKHSMPAGERIALNAAMLRLFKNEYRESSDRHSDALFVRDGLEVALEEIYNLKRELALSQQDYRLLMADLKLVAEARTQLTRDLADARKECEQLTTICKEQELTNCQISAKLTKYQNAEFVRGVPGL